MDDFARALGQVEGQLEGIKESLVAIQASQKDMADRLRKQELKQAGIAAVTGAVASFAVALLGGGGGGPQT